MEKKSSLIKLSENCVSGLTLLVIFGLFYRGLTAYQYTANSPVFQKAVKVKAI